jgi:adenylate kinase family enzyme
MIIHICGAPAAGKTTLSNKFKLKLKNVIVEDLDDLLNEFLKKHKFNEKKYQIYIDQKI